MTLLYLIFQFEWLLFWANSNQKLRLKVVFFSILNAGIKAVFSSFCCCFFSSDVSPAWRHWLKTGLMQLRMVCSGKKLPDMQKRLTDGFFKVPLFFFLPVFMQIAWKPFNKPGRLFFPLKVVLGAKEKKTKWGSENAANNRLTRTSHPSHPHSREMRLCSKGSFKLIKKKKRKKKNLGRRKDLHV